MADPNLSGNLSGNLSFPLSLMQGPVVRRLSVVVWPKWIMWLMLFWGDMIIP